jgi:large subunit ribosomal protein L29
MKSVNTGEIRGHSDVELKRMISESESRLTSLDFQKVTGHLQNSAQISTLRRDIARIKTVLHERELAAKQAK